VEGTNDYVGGFVQKESDEEENEDWERDRHGSCSEEL
jgi:hypothetical protein